MKIKFLLFVFFWAVTPLISQNTNPDTYEETLKEGYRQLKYCYNGEIEGKTLGLDELMNLFEKWKKNIENGPDSKFRHIYPVVLHLVEHIKASLEDTTPDRACEELEKAKEKYLEIDQLPLMKAKGLKQDYMEKFAIDLDAINAFYDSEYCRQTGIGLNEQCRSEEDIRPTPETKVVSPPTPASVPKEEPTPEAVPKKTVESGGARYEITPGKSSFTNTEEEVTLYHDDPIELLRRAISLKLVNTDNFEIEELIPGDSRIIPGVNGVPYEFRLKDADTKEVIFFDPAQYTITDKRQTNKENAWEQYSAAIKDFKTLILNILDVYGNSAFHIYIQGSADKPTFIEKDLVAPYNTAEFQRIDLLKIDPELNRPVPATIEVGEKYDNNELPDLRAAFAKKILALSDRIMEFLHKITIIKGNVKPYDDTTKRNCTMYIYIDWEEAKEIPISIKK
jgi:hypothetical protein